MITITIHRTNGDKYIRPFDVNSIDKIEGETLIEVLAKMLMVVAKIQKSIDKEKELSLVNDVTNNDDIPF